MTEKSLFDKLREKASDVLGSPTAQSASRLGRQVLEITHRLADNKTPLSMAGAIVGSVNIIGEALNVTITSPIIHYANQNNLQLCQGTLHRLLLDAGIAATIAPEKVVNGQGGATSFWRLRLSEQSSVYYTMFLPSSEYSTDEDKISNDYWLSPTFDKRELSQYLWDKYPNGVHLAQVEEKIKINGLPKARAHIKMEHDPAELAIYIKKARKHNVSRSFLLVGPPGSGKTSFCEKLAEQFENRIMKVESSFLNVVPAAEMRMLVEMMQPELLLLDDMDRVDPDQEGKMLFMLETLKRDMPSLVILATVNDVGEMDSALLRPGRLDEKLEFLAAKFDVEMALIEYYCEKFGITPPDREEIEDISVGYTAAKLEELVVRKLLRDDASWSELYDELAPEAPVVIE